MTTETFNGLGDSVQDVETISTPVFVFKVPETGESTALSLYSHFGSGSWRTLIRVSGLESNLDPATGTSTSSFAGIYGTFLDRILSQYLAPQHTPRYRFDQIRFLLSQTEGRLTWEQSDSSESFEPSFLGQELSTGQRRHFKAATAAWVEPEIQFEYVEDD